MDPGPWSPYTYNGLSASGVASAQGTFATAAGQRAVADFQAMGSQPGASQLLLAGMSPAAVAAAANSTFLSSNYEPVFSSLFHHSAQKSQYQALNVAHHRQSLVKPGDSELTAALRDNYMHQSVATSTAAALYEQTSPLNWSQASSSLGSPFGVLPHESVSGSSKSSGSDKKGHIFTEGSSTHYENTFSAHLSPPFAHGYTNSQLSAAAADFRNSANSASYEAAKKVQKSVNHDPKPVTSTASWQGAFSQVTPTNQRECASLPPPPASSFAPSHAQKVQAAANFASRAAAAAIASSAAATAHQQQTTTQSCIVSRPSHHQVPPNLPFVPQHRPSSVPAPMMQEKIAPRTAVFSPKSNLTVSHIPTKAQSKGFPSGPLDASVNSAVPHESSQSSPRYGLDTNHNFSSSSAAAAAAAAAATAAALSAVSSSKPSNIPQAHQRSSFPPPPSAAHMNQYRNYPSPDAAAGGPVSHASEYQRSTPDSIALSPYSDSEPQHCHTQNGGSSSSSGLGRPSPTQTSPLSHTPSPAYPIYNSPMSAPSPLHEAQSCVYSKPPSSQQSSGYPSVIQCNSAPADVKQVPHNRQNFPHSMKQSWEMQEKIARGVREMSHPGVARFPYATESMEVMDEGMMSGNHHSLSEQQRQNMYDTGSTINMQDLTGPSNEEMLSRAEADADEYDRRRGRKIKRRKSGDKAPKQPQQNCGYPPMQNGYFPTAYHENFMARNTPLGGYHPRLGFNPAHMHGQPSPAHAQCGPNAMYQMGPLPLSMQQHQQQQQGPSTSSSPPTPPQAPPEKPPFDGPSVDDELGFLEDTAPVAAPPPPNALMMKPGPSKDNSGFMDSYLKFLRGETETPLTVTVRAGRKSPKVADGQRKNNSSTKSGINTPRNQLTKIVNQTPPATTTANHQQAQNVSKPCPPSFQQAPVAMSSQPLNNCTPELAKKGQVDQQQQNAVPVMLAAQVRQHPEMSSCLMEEKKTPKEVAYEQSVLMQSDMRVRAAEANAKAREVFSDSMASMHRGRGRPPKRNAPVQEEMPEELPIRKPARRKAKEAVQSGKLTELSEDEEPKDTDSDSDPAWTPQTLAEGHKDEFPVQRGWHPRRGQAKFKDSPRKRGRRTRTSYSSVDEDQSCRVQTIGSESESDTEESVRKTKRQYRSRYSYSDSVRTDENKLSPAKEAAIFPLKKLTDEEMQQLFVSGAFIIPRSEVNDQRPNIWRIDGRNLIQKFEHFEEDGKNYYRNVSTYSGWTPESFRSYEIAEVTFIKNTRQETIIQLTKNSTKRKEEALKKRFMLELEEYESPFRTYMQTLVSQVLDRSFLSVIISENDEYFVSNLQKIDDLVDKKRQQLRNVIKLNGNTEELIRTWPSYMVNPLREGRAMCSTCSRVVATVQLKLYGEPYDTVTLSIIEPEPSVTQLKEIMVCKECEGNVDLYSRLVHLKFNHFKLCALKVQETQSANPVMETSDLLQSVLNTDWIDKLFHGLQAFWAQVDLKVYSSSSSSGN